MTCDQVRNDISSLNIWSGGYDGGYDELLPFVGKSCVDAFIEPIMYLVNESLKMPICPIQYCKGVPVYKFKHVIHDMETRTLVMELHWRPIKRWVPCGDMDRSLKIPHSAKVEWGFRTTPEECLYDSSLIGLQCRA